MKCPNCGIDNPAGEEFCSNCGLHLPSAPAAGSGITGTTGAPNVAILSPTGNTSPNPGATTAGGSTNTSTFRTLSPNSHLQNGRYVVEKVLGQGGMGAAMLAKDTRVSDKLVVIKELIADSTDQQQRLEDVNNFKREVKTLAEIEHPLVPVVTDSFEERSRYFMVQAYVPGENLENHLESIKKPMPEREALTYASQVLDILDYLSHMTPPIVHRDIKPANIIIGAKDKRAHLVDFGIARASEAKNAKRKQTSALGTPGYAPPEQYQGNADVRSDMYALAATLHHVLTNRDPREYPPFSYPPARSLNKGLTADVERVLEHALQINIANRYQTVAEMKRDIDAILVDHFNDTGDTSSYTLHTSGPMTSPRTRPAPTPIPPSNTPIPISRSNPSSGYQQQQAARSAYPPPPQSGAYGAVPKKQKQRGNNYMLFSFLLLLLVVVVIGAGFFAYTRLKGTTSTGGSSTGGVTDPTATAAPSTQLTLSNTGIGTATVNGQLIGISDGSYSFDNNRADGDPKQQASSAFLAGNISSAQPLWQSALAMDTSDAEPLIYLENQRVKTAGSPYITLIVGTMLTGSTSDIQVGRDSLQGAYVAQKEFNKANVGGIQVRLLIANSGNNVQNVTAVAQAIVDATKKDTTIVGVMGWPYSGLTGAAVNVLSPAKIPMVSSTASSNILTGVSPYFFRVAPPDKSQAAVGATYAKQKLNAKNVALFVDDADSYSQSLASGFGQQFSNNGGTVNTVKYTKDNADSIKTGLQNALSKTPAPDLIYFAGYSSDVGTILTNLPANSTLNVMGGDALYNLAGYPAGTPNRDRLRFTAFAYPDEWDILGFGSKKPAFFTDYPAIFNPNNNQNNTGGPYGFTRAGYNVVLSFDATLALLDASKNALGSQTTGLTSLQLRDALTKITGPNAIQGVSGQISFGPDGDPINKAVVIIRVGPAGNNIMDSLGAGVLLVG